MVEVGALRASQLRDRTLQTYVRASRSHPRNRYRRRKFEFGIDRHGNLLLAGEIATWTRRGTGLPTTTGPAWSDQLRQRFVRSWLTGSSRLG